MSITIHPDWGDPAAWDAFVEAQPEGRFCQLYGYGEVLAAYGYRPLRVAFLKNGAIAAVLPAAIVRSLLFGKKLVSQPFSEYGGMLLEPSLELSDVERIYALLVAYLARQTDVRALEMHGDQGIPQSFKRDIFARENPHHIAVLPLDRPAAELWQKVVEYSVRKGVNKARANGVEAFEECSPRIIRERFYPLYLKSMKRLGVPPHALAYYLRCAEFLGDRLKIFWAKRESEVLAGLLGFTCGGRVNIVNIVSTPESWKYAPNDLIHWAFIDWSLNSGFKYFDFGSVRYDGQRTYKKKWGVRFEDHGYYLWAPHKSHKPAAFSSSAPALMTLSRLWSNYVPEIVAQFAGPIIRQHLVR